ncbi:hypothetical protein ACFFV7_44615 [Nonomuraea spiralis]|uniref:Uncharacterized protein n=1 Tax=Nonomuraea spiralis TaxID=46182 RepID=A0ABV5IUU1_9ACTN|nr:hypothetical protein [Nonomuraea spiralis]
MEPERTESRGGSALLILGVVWVLGTLVLGWLGFEYSFALMGAKPANEDLGQVLIYLALGLGGGAPVVGLMTAWVLNNKGGTWFYGLVVLGMVIFVIFAMYQYKSRSNHVWQEDPPVCTAPPERAHGVPGC